MLCICNPKHKPVKSVGMTSCPLRGLTFAPRYCQFLLCTPVFLFFLHYTSSILLFNTYIFTYYSCQNGRTWSQDASNPQGYVRSPSCGNATAVAPTTSDGTIQWE